MSVSQETEPEALRLVKLRLPASLVRSMDQAIASSGGAYLDRNEFVSEAVRDRIVEDQETIQNGQAVRREKIVELSAVPKVGHSSEKLIRFEALPTDLICLPRTELNEVNFGLHNRDLPSLWALHHLAQLVTQRRTAVEWQTFVDSVRKAARELAGGLRVHDASQEAGLKASIGFPKPGPKAKASEERFLAGMVGTLSSRWEGPFAILGLAGTRGNTVAPTPEGERLLRGLGGTGLSEHLPHSPESFSIWWAHLSAYAAVEKQAWLKLLNVISGNPTRKDLIANFPEWTGSRAETNCVGLISRSREWGLLDAELVDGRYRLTQLGEETVDSERKDEG